MEKFKSVFTYEKRMSNMTLWVFFLSLFFKKKLGNNENQINANDIQMYANKLNKLSTLAYRIEIKYYKNHCNLSDRKKKKLK